MKRMKTKKRKLTLRSAILCAIAVALVASMTVFFTANAAEGDVVTPTDEIAAEIGDGVGDSDDDLGDTGEVVGEIAGDTEVAIEGGSVSLLDTDTNPYGTSAVTLTTTRKIGERFPIEVEGTIEVDGDGDDYGILIDYGDNNPVEYPGDQILRGNTLRIYGNVTGLRLPYDQIMSFNGNEWVWEIISSEVTSLDVSNAPNLSTLDCSYNKLTSLDLSANTGLYVLNCAYNDLTELDLSNNLQLRDLDCYSNKLTSLDLSAHDSITTLNCNDNRLTSLALSPSADLGSIICSSNGLTSLDVSNYSNLSQLHCGDNNLRSLDVSNNSKLTTLFCQANKISSLELSAQTELTELNCSNNNLTSLDISSSSKLSYFNCSNNALKISTITLNDEATYGEMTDAYLSWNDDIQDVESYEYTRLVEVDFSGQRKVAIPDLVQAGQAIDLSSEIENLGVETVFVWYDEEGNEVYPVSSDGGVFTFGENEVGKVLYCVMTNERLLDRKHSDWPEVENFSSWDEYYEYSSAFYSFYESHDYQDVMPSLSKWYTTKVKIAESDDEFSLPAERTIKMGLTLDLAAELHKPDSMTSKVTWATSKSSVATVSSSGVVKAVAAGKAVITAKCGTQKVTCTVVVESAVVLNKYSLTLVRKTSNPNPATTISGKKPSGVKSIVWKSDNPLVVSVDNKGKLTAHKAGTANITCSDPYGGSVSAPCAVTVADFFITTESTMIGSQAYVLMGQNILFDLDGADGQVITWKTSNSKIASNADSSSSEFLGKAKGTVSITAQTADRKLSDTVKLTVVQETTSISVKPVEVTLYAGSTTSIKASISKNSNEPVFWSSLNEKIATVDKSGKVKGISQGTTVITATTLSGQSASVTVNVNTKATKIAWYTGEYGTKITSALKKGIVYDSVNPENNKIELSFDVISPVNCNDSCKWSTNNSKIVTVEPIEDGRKAIVTAKGTGGTANVTVKTGSGKSLTAKITVITKAATSISLNKTSLDLYEDATYQLTAKTSPKGNNDVVYWRSDNPQAATVDENGKVFAVRQGQARIYATTAAGGLTAYAEVEVRSKVKDIQWGNVDPLPEYWAGFEDYSVNESAMTISKEMKFVVNKGEYKVLWLEYLDPEDSNDPVTWSSSDSKIATVRAIENPATEEDDNYWEVYNRRYVEIYGNKKGTVRITAKTGGGKKLTASVTVVDIPAEEITSNKQEVSVYEGNSATLSAVVSPKGSNDVVLWRSMDPWRVTVDENGRVKGAHWNEYPTTVVAYSATNNNVLCTFRVTVRSKATGIKLSPSSITLEPGDIDFVYCSLTPYYSNDYVTWSSSDAKIVEVRPSNYGDGARVLAKKTGTVTITAKTGSGKSAKIKVTVKNDSDPSATKLRLWCNETDYDFVSRMSAQWEEAYSEDHPELGNVKVRVSVVGEDSAGYEAMSAPQFAADVFSVPSDQVAGLAQTNTICAMPDAVVNQIKATYGEATAAMTSYNGSYYGFPYASNTAQVLFYDKSVFTKEDVKSLNTMLAKDGVQGKVIGTDSGAFYSSVWFFTGGGELFTGSDTSICTFDKDSVAEVLEFVQNNTDKIYTGNTSDAVQAISDGSLSAYMTGSWDAASMASAFGENLGVAMLPKVTVNGETYQMKCFGGMKQYVVNANSKQPEAALSLAQYLASPDVQLMKYEEYKEMGQLYVPTALSLLDNETIAADQAVVAFMQQGEHVVIQEPVIPDDWWGDAQALFNAIFNKEIVGKDAIKKAIARHIQRWIYDPNATNLTLWCSENDYNLMNEASSEWAVNYKHDHPELGNFVVNIEVVGEDVTGNAVLNNPENAADVFGIPSDTTSYLANAGAIYAMPNAVVNQIKTTYGEATADLTSYNGSYYGFPYAANTALALYYDKSVFTEEDVKSLNAMLAKDGVQGKVIGNDSASFFSSTWFFTGGGELFTGSDMNVCTFDQESVAEVLEFVQNNTDKIYTGNTSDAVQAISDGSLSAYMTGSWDAASMASAFGDNLGVAMLPKVTVNGTTYQMKCFGGIKYYAVNAETNQPEAALSLAQYLASPDVQLMKYNYYLNMGQRYLPTAISLVENETIAADPVVLAYLQQGEHIVVQEPVIPSEWWGDAEALYRSIINKGVVGKNAIQAEIANHVANWKRMS